MTTFRGTTLVATAALLLAAMTACADNRKDPEPSGSPTASSTAPSTPPSEQAIASEAASDLLRKFYDVRNQLRQNPDRALGPLDTVAISTELAAQQNLFKKEREEGLHQTGETEIAELTVQAVNLDNSDPQTGKVPTVQIDVCFDVSGVDLIGPDGKSVVSPDRPDTGWIRYSVANYEWDSNPDSAWRVASSQDIERAPCAAS